MGISQAGDFSRKQLFLEAATSTHPDSDLSSKTWVEAFDELNAQMSREYPFTEWKGVNWTALYAKYRPRIAAAQANHDSKAYYLSLREYVYSIPDGHVRLRGDDPKAMLAGFIGGGYGLALTRLDDGHVIAHIILPDGAAERAGIRFGAEIKRWGGQPIAKALERVPLWFDDKPPATRETQRLEQCRYLVRAPIGTKTQVTFKNRGQHKEQTVTLTAADDNLETLSRTNLYATPEERRVPVKFDILPGGYGYIKVTTFPSPQFAPVYDQFKAAIQTFVDKKVTAVILDLRHNGGGDDEVTAKIAGFFYTQRKFYYAAAIAGTGLKQFKINPAENVWIEPQLPHFAGRVLAMVSAGTVSNGEGLALAIQQLPQGDVIGFHASNGAYGETGGSVKMPLGYLVLYPNGRGLDENGNILLESDGKGRGGVVPDLRLRQTAETIDANFNQGRDVELEFALRTLSEQLKNR
ncbi:MAG TPA: S41 family peptidase [Pyrinomonadaceae bacterium]